MSDKDRVNKILKDNRNKTFVKRIVDRDNYPVLDNEDGSVSTHSMAWASSGDRFFAYPTVVLEGGKLKRLEGKEAWQRAAETGDFIKFKSPEEADWFSKNYKKVWEK